MIMIPPTTPPAMPPIAAPEKPFWGEDGLLPKSPALADVELLLVVVGVEMPSVGDPVAVAVFPPAKEVAAAAAEEVGTVPVIWIT
jgi:hypothetical protein